MASASASAGFWKQVANGLQQIQGQILQLSSDVNDPPMPSGIQRVDPEDTEWVNIPSQRSIREMRDIRSMERIVRHKHQFTNRTLDFINAIRSSLVNSEECKVRRRGTWDNSYSYIISYRTNHGEGPLKTVKVNEADWQKILSRLQQDKFNITPSTDNPVMFIRLA